MAHRNYRLLTTAEANNRIVRFESIFPVLRYVPVLISSPVTSVWSTHGFRSSSTGLYEYLSEAHMHQPEPKMKKKGNLRRFTHTKVRSPRIHVTKSLPISRSSPATLANVRYTHPVSPTFDSDQRVH